MKFGRSGQPEKIQNLIQKQFKNQSNSTQNIPPLDEKYCKLSEKTNAFSEIVLENRIEIIFSAICQHMFA